MRRLAIAVLLCTLAHRAEAQNADAPNPPLVGAAAGSCGGWDYPADSAGRLVTIDVLVPEGPSDRLDRPASDTTVQRLRALGAEVVHRFAVPYVRVRLPHERVRELERIADHYRLVPRADRQFARVVVNYTREESDGDIALLRSIGGVLEARMTGAVAAILPDEAIQSLRRRAEVASIVAPRVICLDM